MMTVESNGRLTLGAGWQQAHTPRLTAPHTLPGPPPAHTRVEQMHTVCSAFDAPVRAKTSELGTPRTPRPNRPARS
eukprot:1706788-Rhodomonas_salina.1